MKDDIYTMYREHLIEKSRSTRCEGQEAPDHPEQNCDGRLEYTIKVVYKE